MEHSSGSDTDDHAGHEAARRPEVFKLRRLGVTDAVSVPAAPPPSPADSSGSDGTISDVSGAAAAAAPVSFSCRICWKRFASAKAVYGHMKVHDPNGRQVKDEVDSAMEIVVAETKLSVAAPAPMVIANPNGSTMAIVVAAAGNHPPPSNQVIVAHHPPAAKRFECSEAGCNRSFATYQALGGHMAGHVNRRRAAAAAAAKAGVHPGGGSGVAACGGCGCGCGGAMAPEPEKKHVCKDCGVEYEKGVQLGGHMRKHYVVPAEAERKRKATAPLPRRAPPMEVVPAPPAAVEEAEVSTELTLAPPMRTAAPPPPASTRSIRIFGAYLTVRVPAEEQDPAVKQETDDE